MRGGQKGTLHLWEVQLWEVQALRNEPGGKKSSAVCIMGQATGMASLRLLVKKLRDAVEENKNIMLEKQEYFEAGRMKSGKTRC